MKQMVLTDFRNRKSAWTLNLYLLVRSAMLIIVLSGLSTSTFSQDCYIQPKFEWRRDSVDCKRIWFINYSQPSASNIRFTWKFGDGTTSNEFQPSHQYSQPGNYTACLVMDSAGICVREYCQYVQVSCDTCNIQIDFNYQREPSDPNRFYFVSAFTIPPGTVPQFFWNFGDDSTSNIPNPIHRYDKPGTYNVCLKLYISSNCFKEVCKTVIVGDTCLLEVRWRFTADSANPQKINFYGETNASPIGANYKWFFGDGATSTEINPVHIYDKPGDYNVCLRVAINNTCIRESCKTIRVDTSGCWVDPRFEFRIDSLQKNKVYFLNRTYSNQQVVHYLWKFGDGKTSGEINPVHIYEQPGIYEVCLVAETENGCRSVYCDKVVIGSVVCQLEPKFEWKASEETPGKIYFKNLTIVPASGAKYLWKFGDGTISTEKDPVHVYEKPGVYEVCLIVELNNLCRKVSCQRIVIQTASCNVQAKFEWKQDATNWRKIWFANLSQPVPNIWRTYWTYGDGSSSQDYNSFHEYQIAGTYYVCLKVVSLNGCIVSYCDSVVVRKKDSCENRSGFRYEAAPNNLLEIKFKPEHINTAWKYHWKFGDGKQSTAITPVHKYEKPGVYNVCLTVVQSNGCQTTTCKEIKVGASCESVELKFEYRRQENRPNKIQFKAVSNQQLVKQKWTIRRDSTIYGFPFVVVLHQNNPTFIFPFTGWYTVCLEAKTANGCVKQYCERIYIDKVVWQPINLAPIAVFPNPTRSLARIQLRLETSVKINVTVLDESGAVKYQLQVGGQAGNNTINLPVDKLAQGQYLVQLSYGNEIRWARFQKM